MYCYLRLHLAQIFLSIWICFLRDLLIQENEYRVWFIHSKLCWFSQDHKLIVYRYKDGWIFYINQFIYLDLFKLLYKTWIGSLYYLDINNLGLRQQIKILYYIFKKNPAVNCHVRNITFQIQCKWEYFFIIKYPFTEFLPPVYKSRSIHWRTMYRGTTDWFYLAKGAILAGGKQK